MRRLVAVSGLLACAIALVMLGLSVTLRSEPIRAVAVLIGAGSLCYGWGKLRPHLQSLDLVKLRVGFSMGALACAWSGLNVVRFYLYNPAMEGAAIYSTWYEVVCTTQVVIQWCLVVLAVMVLILLAMSPFRTRSHSIHNSKR